MLILPQKIHLRQVHLVKERDFSSDIHFAYLDRYPKCNAPTIVKGDQSSDVFKDYDFHTGYGVLTPEANQKCITSPRVVG